MTLALSDFQQQLRFSTGIEWAQIAAFVDESLTLDVRPLVRHDTLEAIDELAAFTVVKWSADLAAQASGTYVIRRERIWRATMADADPANIPTESTGTGTGWAYDQMRTLWHVYLKPYWVQAVFARFYLWHSSGNITKAGVTVPIDHAGGTYDKPYAGQIAAVQASADETAAARLNRLGAFLRAENLFPVGGATAASPYPSTSNADGDMSAPHQCGGNSRRRKRPIRGV